MKPIYLSVDLNTGKLIDEDGNEYTYHEGMDLLNKFVGRVDMTMMANRFVYGFEGDLKRLQEFYK